MLRIQCALLKRANTYGGLCRASLLSTYVHTTRVISRMGQHWINESIPAAGTLHGIQTTMQCLHRIALFLDNLESEENFTMRIIADNAAQQRRQHFRPTRWEQSLQAAASPKVQLSGQQDEGAVTFVAACIQKKSRLAVQKHIYIQESLYFSSHNEGINRS